jgi:putative hydrolase of the HAD superfamily
VAEPAVVFDIGAVLLRWRPVHLVRQTLGRHVPDDDAALAWAKRIFRGAWTAFDRGTADAAQTARQLAADTGLPEADLRALIDAVPAELEPLAETVDLLERLHARGHALYYLSNMPEPLTHHVARQAFFGRFTDGVFSSHVKLIKPEPEIFTLAARRFGITPSRTVFIDDMAGNVVAARAQGWHAIRFVSAAQVEADLEALELEQRQGGA